MAQSNSGNQRFENIVGPDGIQGGSFVNSTINHATFNIVIKEEAEKIKTKTTGSAVTSGHGIEDAPAQALRLSITGRARSFWSDSLGYYSLTEEQHNERPVYRNGYGYHLWSQEDGTWAANDIVGQSEPVIRSTFAAVSPHLCQQWQYRDYASNYKLAEVIVTKSKIR